MTAPRNTRSGCSAGDEARPNPLVELYGVPRFDEIAPEHATPAVELLLADLRSLIERLEKADTPVSWDALHVPLDDATDRLILAWGLASHDYGLSGSQPWQSGFEALQPRVIRLLSETLQSQALFRGYQGLRQEPMFSARPALRRRIVELRLRDFRLGGAELPAQQRARLTSIQEETSRLGSHVDDNIRNARDAFASLRETGPIFSIEWGERFVRELLGVGGSRPAAESYRALRGRAATVDALLADYGLAR